MSNTNQPESAFPSTFKSLSPEEGQVHRWGMTLRDYFAAKAMQSFILAACTNENAMLTVMNKLKTEVEYEDWLAYSAYDIADAMLKQRQI